MKNEKNTTLGLDLGIASVGWCLFENDEQENPKRIIDLGSFVFNQIENKKTGQTENIARRQKRSMRRQRRRKVRRLEAGRYLFQNELDVDFRSLNLSQIGNPLELKIKGLHEKLTKEELCVALYHYLKYRGFKSNRKSDKNAEDTKLLEKFKATAEGIQPGQYITEYLCSKANMSDRVKKGIKIHNTSEEYNLTVTRDLYEKEINALLDKQITCGIIGSDFKNKFLTLFNRQRDFSDGPGKESPFSFSIEAMIGESQYSKEGQNSKRAPKDSFTAQKFIFLSSLCNFRYIPAKADPNGEIDFKYVGLEANQIKRASALLKEKQIIKYKDILKVTQIEPLKIKNLTLSKKEYKNVFDKLEKEKGITKQNLNEENQKFLSDAIEKAKLDKTFFKRTDFLNEYFKKLKEDKFKDIKGELEKEDIIDSISYILLIAKTDEKIKEKAEEENLTNLISFISELPNSKNVIDLSLDVCKDINPELEKGVSYTNALENKGYKSKKDKHTQKNGKLPDIDTALSELNIKLKNPVVKHSLVQLRKVINAVVDKYGAPSKYCLELGRELKKGFNERKEIKAQQDSNRYDNISAKLEILEKYPTTFRSIQSINKDALLKYKLFKEQRGISPYSNKQIRESDLFNNNYYQIDHILPYSRSFDDSFSNKVLVETELNQNKGNKTPFECSSIFSEVKSFISSHYVESNKREKLLTQKIDENNQKFIGKDAGDNSYIATIARDLIDAFLLPEEKYCQTVSGAITAKMRSLYRLGGKKHSFYPNSSFETHYISKPLTSYKYESINVNENGIELKCTNISKPYEVLLNKKSGKKELSPHQQKENELLNYFKNNIDIVNERFSKCINEPIEKLSEISKISNGADDLTKLSEACIFVIGKILNKIQKEIEEKDRSNDLHHAVDAALIGCVNAKTVKRISDYYKNEEVDELITSGNTNFSLPLPYLDFDKEVMLRVYERNINKLIENLKVLPMYQAEQLDVRNIHVLIPARLPDKDIKGAISKETIFGLTRKGELTSTISTKEIKQDQLEKICDKDGGNKAVKESIEKWIKEKKPTEWPLLEKKNTPIKKVKIIKYDDTRGKVDLSRGRFAENDSCIRVRIYKSKNDNDKKIYMVPIYYYQLLREETIREQKKKNRQMLPEPVYQLMASPNDVQELTTKQIYEKYILISEINRYSLIEIETRDEKKFLAYSGGLTKGLFEIYSLIGDNYDMANSRAIGSANVDRIRPGINTIKSIKVRSISPLGIIS